MRLSAFLNFHLKHFQDTGDVKFFGVSSYFHIMKILVRLPNWLGDMVMSTSFLRALQLAYPGAEIDVIVKKGLDSLLDFIPGINRRYVFSKEEWKGLKGVFLFGRNIKKEKEYDLFFCLPDSFSSAVMAWATKAKKRIGFIGEKQSYWKRAKIGFEGEFRSYLLTNSYLKFPSSHRVEQYVSLLQQFHPGNIEPQAVILEPRSTIVSRRVIVNLNSEAISRRMPVPKGTALLNSLVKEMPDAEFVCIGSAKEKQHVDAILSGLDNPDKVINNAGQTRSLPALIQMIGSGAVMLTTDSGPAHIANALGVPVVVLFGAGNEKNTAPYNGEQRTVLRLGELRCEPCVKNTCIYGLPKCLELLDEQKIITAVKRYFY
jgi:lipopolysaccharide heptosyltransferase II